MEDSMEIPQKFKNRRLDQDDGVGGCGAYLPPQTQTRQKYIYFGTIFMEN